MKTLSQSKRILLKLSGEALQGKQDHGIDVEFLENLVKKIVYLAKEKKIQIIIVIGGGNIFRGATLASKGLVDRGSGDYMGMLATVMNGIALGNAIEKNGIDVSVMSALEMPKVAESFIIKKALSHLSKGRIIVSVAGTGNPYFTTDSAAVLRALELNCDFLVKGTKVDGVYDKDPVKFKDAIKYDNLSYSEALIKGLKIMDQSAIALAKDENLPIFVCKIEDIDKIGGEEKFGTVVG